AHTPPSRAPSSHVPPRRHRTFLSYRTRRAVNFGRPARRGRRLASPGRLVKMGRISRPPNPRPRMSEHTDVLCAGIVVADHVCTPVSHLPAAGELVLADRLLLTIGGCAANVAVDLTRMGVPAAVVGRVGGDVFGRAVADMLREQHVDVSALTV